MKKYSTKSIKDWFSRAYGIEKTIGKELLTHCPKCKKLKFYFNVYKELGFCQYDKCHWSPTLDDLIDRAGYSPDQWGVSVVEPIEELPVVVELPGKEVVYAGDQQLMTYYPEVVQYLNSRGLTAYDAWRFKMTFDGQRVYVPVYKGDTLINYVGRDLTGTHAKKYLYCPGAKTSEWLFGWDESQAWDRLSLVENTFVSIFFRSKIQCSTNFGSHLSNTQIKLIARTGIQSVALLWDENAHFSAQKAVERLRQIVPACFVYMSKQPDDHSEEEIIEIANECHTAALKGEESIDPFNIKLDSLKE